jgi:prepilin-type N-terminal cleavage/methylation domain-containing protein/prepilin-type processing-associated H-X9-DG protein
VRRHCCFEKGFTLIELVVVISIIGVLAALLLPALSKTKANARSNTCKNHQHQMGLALQMYVDEHQSKYPYYRGFPDPSYDDVVGADNRAYWSAKLLPYYSLKWTDPKFHCPGYKGAIKLAQKDKDGFTFPTGSYAYNADGVKRDWLTNHLTLGLGGNSRSTTASEGQIKAPSEMFAIGESRWKAQEGYDGGFDFMLCGYLGNNRGYASFDAARHGKNYNQLFCDGHVSAMSPWVLFNPTNSAVMWNYDHQPHPEYWPKF